MGSDPISSVARVGLAAVTGGMSEISGVGKKLAGKKIKTKNGSSIAEVTADRDNNIKRRKALYETKGDVLGEEVSGIGSVGRKNLFGN